MKIKGEKISWIMSHLCDGNADFAEKMGERTNTVSNWVLRGCGLNVAGKIMSVFPQVSLSWLLIDEGKPINNMGYGETEEVMEAVTRRFIDTYGKLVDNEGADGMECSDEWKRKMAGVVSGVSHATIDMIGELSGAYPSVNADYILTGRGEPLLGAVTPREGAAVELPVAPINTSASFVDNLIQEGGEMETMLVAPLEGEKLDQSRHMVFPITGNSMEPTIHGGSLILGERVEEGSWDSVSGIVVIVYNRSLTIKRVQKNALYSSNALLLRADNPTHGEMTVERSEIRGIWKARRVISCPID